MTTSRTVGAYKMLTKIGQGGMGEVWLGEHSLLGRRAAVKLLKPAIASNEDALTRFFNEARAAATISDPGIVQIFDFGSDAGGAYIVMELLEGEPLDRRLERVGKLAIHEALRTVRQIASSLGAAHARGIIHRDLKPENIYLVRDPEVAGGERAKILDFGIAKLAGDPMALKTQTAALIGTPMFMSPEQCRGSAVDARTDIYSLGCMLFLLITGQPPFMGEGVGDIIAKHMMEPAPRAAHLVRGITPALDALIARCLAKPAAERPANGTELAAAIDALLAPAPHPVAPTMMSTVPPGLLPTLPPPMRTPSGTSPPGYAAQASPYGAIATPAQSPYAANATPGAYSANATPAQAAYSAPAGATPAAIVPPAITTLSRSAISLPAQPSAARGKLIAIGAGIVGVSTLVTWLALRNPGSKDAATLAAAPPAPPVKTRVVEPPSPAKHEDATADVRPARARAQLADALASFAAWATAHPTATCPTARDLGVGVFDPWGHALVTTCTDQPADQRVGVISLGPDGIAGTKDDVSSWSLDADITAVVHGPRWTPKKPVAATPPPPVKRPPAQPKSDRFKGTQLGSDGIPISR
jgi:serine/threonine-protein kinase